MTLKEIIEKCKKLDPKIWIASYVLISAFILYWYPSIQVSHFEISNSTTIATLENEYRTNLTQILGGGAVAIGIYFAWKNFIIAQDNLRVSQEGQITERFTRAVDQLGNDKLEIRLGGIYALERIANESEKDYWPIMEILTAYVRKNASLKANTNKKFTFISMDIQADESTTTDVPDVETISIDIQAVLIVIGRRKYFFNAGESIRLNLSGTYLRKAILKEFHLERTNFGYAHLQYAYLGEAHLEQTVFIESHLENSYIRHAYLENSVFIGAHLENADFSWSHLEEALLIKAHMERTVFRYAYLQNADFEGADFEGANFEGADFSGARNLTVDQLSKVKTLYKAELDKELLIPLQEKYSFLFNDPYVNE